MTHTQFGGVSRRNVITCLACSSLLTACSSQNISSLSNIYKAANYAITSRPEVDITREDINNIPYASCYARIGDNPRALVILAKIIKNDLYWVTANRETFVTRKGRLVKTHGLQSDLTSSRWNNALADIGNFVVGSTNRESQEYGRTIDIKSDNIYGIYIRSHLLRQNDAVSLEIEDLVFDTTLVIETNIASTLRWEFSNYFWVDNQTGFIWKSIQHFAPSAGPLIQTILKPAKMG